MNNNKMNIRKINKLLVCGGGFKFYYIYGSIRYLYEINVLQNITEYIGVSAGAMLSLLFVIGYTPNDLEKFFLKTIKFIYLMLSKIRTFDKTVCLI
jgi:predicted acylesterase/phospholipase RssA